MKCITWRIGVERIVGVAVITLALHGQASGQATFIPLGFLPNGNAASAANAVSAGSPYVVVGYANTTGNSREAFRWSRADGMISLGGNSEAFDVSADGSVIVGRDYGGGAWRWTSAGGRATIGPGAAQAVSADGSVIAGQNNDRGFRWTSATGQVALPLLPGATFNYNPANGISADGRYIVGQGSTASYRGYRYDVNTNHIQVLAPMYGAYDITPDGRTIVGEGGSMMRLVDGVVATDFYLNGGTAAQALAVSADGLAMVGYTDELEERAVIWESVRGGRLVSTMLKSEYQLDLPGWHLFRATDISADGKAIVGWGRNPSGFHEGWLAIVPEPGSAAFVLLVAAAGTSLRRARRALS